MIALSPTTLAAAMGISAKRAALWAPHLVAAMTRYQIDTPARAAMWLAQIGHESGSLVYVREIASGHAYEGRADLGNTQDGDGTKFRGRGLIQITGRANYLACSQGLYRDDRLIHTPALLEDHSAAAHSAGWFWWTKKLNPIADLGTAAALLRVTRIINGGRNGWDDRLARWRRVLPLLGAQ